MRSDLRIVESKADQEEEEEDEIIKIIPIVIKDHRAENGVAKQEESAIF